MGDAAAEKPWDGCPCYPTLSWDRHWSRVGCRCFCCYVLVLCGKKPCSRALPQSHVFPLGEVAGEGSPDPGGASAQQGAAGLSMFAPLLGWQELGAFQMEHL